MGNEKSKTQVEVEVPKHIEHNVRLRAKEVETKKEQPLQETKKIRCESGKLETKEGFLESFTKPYLPPKVDDSTLFQLGMRFFHQENCKATQNYT